MDLKKKARLFKRYGEQKRIPFLFLFMNYFEIFCIKVRIQSIKRFEVKEKKRGMKRTPFFWCVYIYIKDSSPYDAA